MLRGQTTVRWCALLGAIGGLASVQSSPGPKPVRTYQTNYNYLKDASQAQLACRIPFAVPSVSATPSPQRAALWK